ncbi:MAG TPA: hypothetical protein VFS21_31920 [Roseiflexaceae bacterium]|nr:hypothetical protein [Roseiflexaceae bacterium]
MVVSWERFQSSDEKSRLVLATANSAISDRADQQVLQQKNTQKEAEAAWQKED